MSIIQLVNAGLLFILLLAVTYYYILLAASIAPLRRGRNREKSPVESVFAVIIPAHNEDRVIGQTVTHLMEMNYSQDKYDVIVIADHCDDNTAGAARDAGAICLERDVEPRGRKGHALAWYLEEILPADRSYEAIVVFDADSRPVKDFLTFMSSSIASGASVLQGQHVISNPADSSFTRMADIDMRLNNRLRNLARSNLGLSSRLMGDAMCFQRSILERYPWSAYSLVEDREYGIQLIDQGIRIDYVPPATSMGQAAAEWSRAKSQRMRWSGGVLELRRKYALKLLSSGLRNGNASAVDQSFELLIPPLSLLTLGAAAFLLLQVILSSLRLASSLAVAAGITIALFFVPVFGLILDRAPASMFLYVFLGPFYAFWRLWINFLTVLRRGRISWIRTKRSEES